MQVDSLDGGTANKLMALVDRNDPKDVYDIYFLLTKKNYTLKKLARSVEKKFGLHLAESTILSETQKSLKDIHTIKPLIIAKTTKEKQKIINEIQAYFSALSKKYLDRVLR